MKNQYCNNWVTDYWSSNEKRSYKVKNTLHENSSKYHNIRILDIFDKGITLFLNDHARVFEIDEFIFHEGCVNAAVSRTSNAISCLIIGDGDGGLVREVLKHKNILEIDWVEIDEAVVVACEKFLPTFPQNVFSDKRVSAHFLDGTTFIEECSKKYDIIFISVSVGEDASFATPFKEEALYKKLIRLMGDRGILVYSLDEFSPSSFYDYKKRFCEFETHFNFTLPFSIPLPSFGSNWGFGIASMSKIPQPTPPDVTGLKFYSEISDRLMFDLPEYLLKGK